MFIRGKKLGVKIKVKLGVVDKRRFITTLSNKNYLEYPYI